MIYTKKSFMKLKFFPLNVVIPFVVSSITAICLVAMFFFFDVAGLTFSFLCPLLVKGIFNSLEPEMQKE